MMKCPGCGDWFAGPKEFCPVCRRAADKAHNRLTVTGPHLTASAVMDRHIEKAVGSLPGDALLGYMVDRTLDVLIDKGLCPTCGQKIRKPAMSNAERQRRYRERKRAKL